MCLPDQATASTIQTVAVLVGNVLSFNFGLTFATTTSQSELYESTNTPLNHSISSGEGTWISGCLFLSVAVGSLLGLISPKIGPKSVLMLCGLLQITGWFSVLFAYDIQHIYSSRIFAGIAAGSAFAVLPIYINEIANAQNKAALTVSIECCRAFGIIVGFLLGLYVPYDYVSIIGFGVSMAFTMACPFIQESPFYFIRKGNEASFEKSLRWFRGIRSIDDRNDTVYLQELWQIKNNIECQSKIAVTKMSKSYLAKLMLETLRTVAIPLMLYGAILSLGTQLSGVYVIFNYAAEIFKTTPLKFSMDINILILAVIQLFGTVISNRSVGSVNRKISLCLTSFISVLSLAVTALYLTYNYRWQLGDNLKPWILLILLAVHLMCVNIGITSLSSVVLMEILPSQLQSRFVSFFQFASWLLTFCIIQFFPLIVNVANISTLFWLFTIGGLCVTVFSGFFLDNTRSITPKEIQEKMGHITNGHIAQLSPIDGHFKTTNANNII